MGITMRTAAARRAARRARVALAVVNYAVCVLDVIAFAASLEARDALAALAWLGSGTFWAWQAVTSPSRGKGNWEVAR